MNNIIAEAKYKKWNYQLKSNLSRLLYSQSINSQLFIHVSQFVEDALFLSFDKTYLPTQKIFRVLEQSFSYSTQKLWINLFLVHGIMQFTISQQYSNKVIVILIKQIQKVQKSIQKRIKKESQEKISFIDRSLQKIKRSLSLSSIKNDKNKRHQQHKQKKQSSQNIISSILLQYSDYLNKILNDIQLYQSYQISPKTRFYNKIINKNPTKFKNIIWKIINLFKKLDKMIKRIQHLKRFFKDNNKYVFPLINFFVSDIQILYQPLVDYVEYRRKQIVDYYQKQISNLKKDHKDKYKQKLIALSKDENFVQYKIIIDQYAKVNQYLLYIFFGLDHARNIVSHSTPIKIVATNNQKFDKLFQIYELVQNQKKKQIKEQQSIKNQKNVFLTKMNLNNAFTNSTMKAVRYKSARINQLKQVQQLRKKNLIQPTIQTQRFSQPVRD